eukprot:Skav206480  [mRNA]  locus=scaffold1672:436456:438040:- [translate_table: standard]
MAPGLAEYLEVPAVLFRDVEVLCQRFDFDGSGVLDRKQKILRHKRKQLGPRHLPMDVPEMSLASSKSEGDEDCLEDLLTEYTLMKDFSHKNVRRSFHQVFQDSEFFYLVNEPYFGGDLTKLGKRAHDQGLSMSEAWWREIFRQCLEGLEYLHSQAAPCSAVAARKAALKLRNEHPAPPKNDVKPREELRTH